jgi:hypothetical protein
MQTPVTSRHVAKFLACWSRRVLVSSLLTLCPVNATEQWNRIAINGIDLLKQKLRLDEGWHTGVVRTMLVGTTNDTWRIYLDYGAAGQLTLDRRSAIAQIVREDANGIVIDVPLVPGAVISATASDSKLQLHVQEIITPSGIRVQQLIPGSPVRSLPKSATGGEANAASAIARAELLSATGQILGYCTAFRIKRGYWMTAAHCAYRDAEHASAPTISSLRIQPDAYSGRVESSPAFIAKPIASGLKARSPTAESLMATGDLDYTVLEATEDPGGSVLSLDGGQQELSGRKLRLLQHWLGELPPSAGKAIADGDSCMVLKPVGPRHDRSRLDLCTDAIQHGCSSQGGASGGPLVDRNDFKILALHYGAGLTSKFNCGLPIQTITLDLCQRANSLAREVIKCP